LHDFGELAVCIEVKTLRCTETISEWRREHPDARGCTDQREGWYLQAQRLRRGSLPNHDVDGAVFHGWIEDLFHGASEAMNLVNKEHLSWCKVRQDRGEISAMIDRRTGGEANLDAKFVCNDRSERSLPKPRRAVQKQVISRLAAFTRSLKQGCQ
jgi:hypothetical protein